MSFRFALLQAVLHAVIAVRAPHEARTPKDERERLIELKAARVGFYAVVIGEVLALGSVHVHGSFRLTTSLVMIAVLLGWLIKLGSEISFYRRG
jgi:hypothetical protein